MAGSTRIEDAPFGRLHQPADAGPHPGVVLIHDVWGLTEHSRALAADLAAEGFAVLEIDLYRDRPAYETADPGEIIRSLPDPEVLADLERGADWLRDRPPVQGQRVGVMGVCMGGMYALLAACLSDRFAAAAPFYGLLSYEHGLVHDAAGRDSAKKPYSPLEVADRLCTPLLASFGGDDEFVPKEDVEALERGLRASGVRFEVDVYEGAGHAFLNKTREAAFRPEASARAWSRVVPFLHSELGAARG